MGLVTLPTNKLLNILNNVCDALPYQISPLDASMRKFPTLKFRLWRSTVKLSKIEIMPVMLQCAHIAIVRLVTPADVCDTAHHQTLK